MPTSWCSTRRRSPIPPPRSQQLATGIDVFVNGVQVLDAGRHTGATPGRVVRGPGGWLGRRGDEPERAGVNAQADSAGRSGRHPRRRAGTSGCWTRCAGWRWQDLPGQHQMVQPPVAGVRATAWPQRPASAVAWLLHVLVSGKFWVLFSLLFGMGFAVMMERARASGAAGGFIRRRRCCWCSAWPRRAAGSATSAARSPAAAAALRRSPSVQLALGLTVPGNACAVTDGPLLMVMPPDMMGITPGSLADSARAAEAAAAVSAGGGFAEVTAQRVRDFGSLSTCGAWY